MCFGVFSFILYAFFAAGLESVFCFIGYLCICLCLVIELNWSNNKL